MALSTVAVFPLGTACTVNNTGKDPELQKYAAVTTELPRLVKILEAVLLIVELVNAMINSYSTKENTRAFLFVINS